MIFREGFQNEDFVAFYNGNKFYTGPLDSNFTEALEKLISLRALAFGDIVEYLESIGVSDVNIDDTFDVASTFSKTLFYDAADGEDYWNFDGFEIFPEYELAESFRKRKIRNYSESIRRLNEKNDYQYKGNAFYSFGYMQQIKSNLEFLQRLYDSAVDNQLAATSESKKLYAVANNAVKDAVKAFVDLLDTYDEDYLSK